MHGNSPEFLLLVNAEVDSMGGVIDGGVGIDSKISPRRAAIEKAQAELRQEYDVREERRRELEFLEKGGNPLDFKLGFETSISVQSTSVADQFVNSEAKDSFALTASPCGDSVEESSRPGAPLARETNTADNLLLFDGENDTVEGERNRTQRSRSNIPPSEHVSQLDGCHNVKESEDSGINVNKSQAYARRNRSRSSRDSARSTDLASVADRNRSSATVSRIVSRDAKGNLWVPTMEKERTIKSSCNSKSTKLNGNMVGKAVDCDNLLDRESDAWQAYGLASGSTKVCECEPDVSASKKFRARDQSPLPQVDADKLAKDTTSVKSDDVVEQGLVSFALEQAAPRCMRSAASTKMENVISASQPNRFSTSNVNEIDTSNEGGNSTGPPGSLDPESFCIQVGHSVDGYTSRDQHPALRITVSPVKSNEDVVLGETSTNAASMDVTSINLVKEEIDNKVVEVPSESNDNHTSGLNSNNSVSGVKVEEETGDGRTSIVTEVKSVGNHERIEPNDQHVSNTNIDSCDLIVDDSNIQKVGLCPENRPSTTTDSTDCDPLEGNISGRDSKDASKLQTFDESQLKIDKKLHEDSILEEARSIEAKRKRIAELSVRHYPLDYRRKSHWDFLLEEMAWLANDFMQERLWKTTAAVQISYMAASNGRLRINKQDLCCKQKQIAHTLTKSIMQFWRSAEELLNSDPSIVLENCKLDLVGSHKVDEHDAIKGRITDTNTEMSGHLEEQIAAKSHCSAVQEYAVRFLKFSRSLNCPILAEAPKTPERSSDLGIVDMLLKERFSEETLFYTVPPGAMEEYRQSVDNYWSQYEKTGVSMHQEEVETSIYGAVEEFGTRENVYEEDEREAGAYYLPGALEGSKSSKSAQKKKKHLHKSYSRSYDVGSDLPYGQFMENKPGTHHSLILGKRPSNNLSVGSIPIKRVRTASRQRVVCAGSAVLMPTKADASSGDTSSYQDDQSTAHGGSHIRKTLEVELTGEFGKQLPFDCTEVSMRPKKKKKAKHLVFKNSINSTENGAFVTGKGPAYEQRWQLNSMVQTEQRDYSRKRLETQAFESNGNSGVFGQHATKRPKISKHLQDTSESITPVTGSVPSPVASQMSNMSNPNKFMKMIGGRERGRKKTPKVPAGQSGSGNQWSLFEDQALVVLVHDMGPNWELVSDAISSTLQFKCIFKNPKECKERHKVLMDRSAGDGADSAEDSGSSQPYPSTLPGIPKGSARQLFQRLQGPMEEDTLKHHFEKIISVGKKQHSRKNDNQALKQITAVHNSHGAALNQVCPNNMSGVILTPLDLCDTTTSSSDAVSLGYQGPHSSGLAISNQSPTPPALPSSGANSLLQGSSAMVLENSLSSPSAGLNTSSRDGQRYGVPRPSSLPNNENQKVQQYNQMLPGKNIQHSSVSAPVSLPADRGVRMLPGGNGMGMMSGMSRGMPMPRPGFQGMGGSPAMLNMVSSGSMLPSSGVGMPNPLNLHNGAVSGQANSMMRSREALHMMRSPDEQRQMTMQELQMQATQGNNQCIPPFNGLSTGYSNQTGSPPVQTFPVQNQQQHQMSPQHSHVLNNAHHSHLQGSNHAANPQQQAYMLRIGKPQQRQLHQRIMHQPNQQQLPFASSNATMPHVQPPSQHPISSSLQNSSQIQQQASSQPVSLASSNAQHSLTSSSVPMNPLASQSQQKQNHMPSHGHGRNSQGAGSNLPNQMSKQRQRQQQQHQQPGRNHPQQRQSSQSQQQAKLMKGMGRGNMIMHQNVPIDSSHVNGVSVTSGNQVAEKGEQVMHLMQGQGLFSGSSSNPVPPGKPLVVPQPSNQGSSQQKLFTRSPPPSSKQAVQMPSLADNSQGPVPPISSGHSLLASQQPVVPLAMSPSQQQQQPLVRQVGHSQQSVHRMIQQNRQASSDSSFQSCVDEIQVNQQPINSTFHIATSMALPHCVPESTSVVPVSSANSPSQWKAREPLYDLGAPNATSHLASIGNPSLQSSSGAESGALPIQGVCQRQSSGSTPIHSHNVQTQWQSHSQQHKQPPPQQSSPPSTQPLSQQPKLQSQQQPQPNLQSVQGGPYAAPTNSGPG